VWKGGFFQWFCDVTKVAMNGSENNLAKFGYLIDMKVGKNYFYVWELYCKYCSSVHNFGFTFYLNEINNKRKSQYTVVWIILQDLVLAYITQELHTLLHGTIRQTWRWHIMDCNYALITCYNSKGHLNLSSFVGLDV